jgi:hypothetical protein
MVPVYFCKKLIISFTKTAKTSLNRVTIHAYHGRFCLHCILFVAGWILGFKLIVGESVCFIPTFILFGFFRLTDERAGVEVDFIPAGYTSCLQVLDKGVNKPFKQFIQQQSIKWLQSTPARCKTQPCHYY